MLDRLTEGLARELWRLNRRFSADTIAEWEDADIVSRERTLGQAANFINEARREGAEEERERLRGRAEKFDIGAADPELRGAFLTWVDEMHHGTDDSERKAARKFVALVLAAPSEPGKRS